jgi:hypothetical protein
MLSGGGVGRLEKCLKRRQITKELQLVQRQRGRGRSGQMTMKTRIENQMTILKIKLTGGVLQEAWAAVKVLPRQRQVRVPQPVNQ